MGGANQRAAGEQQRSEALIQFMESHCFDQQHQVGETCAEQLEDVTAERLMPREELFEQRQRHGNQRDCGFSDAGGCIVDVSEQAAAGQHAAFAGRDAIEQDFPALLRNLGDADRAFKHQRKGRAAGLFIEQPCSRGCLHQL